MSDMYEQAKLINRKAGELTGGDPGAALKGVLNSPIAQGALLGAVGGQAGIPGTLAASAVAAWLAYQKAKQQPGFKLPNTGIATTDGSGGGGGGWAAGSEEAGNYKKGGKVAKSFGGEISAKMLKKPRMAKVHAPEISQSLSQQSRATAPPRVTPPSEAPFRAGSTGRFAKGGLVRGMGSAIRGKTFGGEC